MLREVGAGLLDLWLPPRCCSCERWLTEREPRGAALCESCRAALDWIDADACARCQQQPRLAARQSCAACAAAPGPLAACTAAVHYRGAVPGWITRFKYPAPGLRGLDAAPPAIAAWLAAEAARRVPGPAPARIVPVPLHAARLRERGFNPAALIAREVARACAGRADAPRVDFGLLERRRATVSQTGLGRAARARNVRGAFAVVVPAHGAAAPRSGRFGCGAPRTTRPAGETIWLVDDVVTTGATLEACARALRSAGAGRICAVALARTPPPGADAPAAAARRVRARRATPRQMGDSRATRMAHTLQLLHRPTTGDEPRRVELRAGDPVDVIEDWAQRLLVRDARGRLFTVPREAVEES